MAGQNVTVKINGVKKEYPQGTRFLELAKEYQSEYAYPIVLAKEDGRLRELMKKISDGTSICFVTLVDKAGYSTYRRSMILLMLKAFYHVVGDNANIDRIGVHFAVSGGYFCTLQGRTKLSRQLLDDVKEYMHALVKEAAPIEKRSIPTTEARRRFREYRMYDKEQLFRYRRASRVNIYSLKSFEDYYYGYMVPDASYLSCFDLKLFEDGFVLQFPPKGQPQTVPEFRPEMKIYHVQRDSMEWGSRLGIPTVGALNDFIVQHTAKELIMIQEAFHEKKIAEIAAQIAAKPEQKIVLIAGPSSSGKTTFSHRLSTQLSVYGLKPHPIAADDYFVDREHTPKDENGNYNFECLEAIDVEQFNEDMTRLLAGEEVELPTFNFKTGRREYKGNFKKLGQDDILVIEGIHGLNDKLSHSLDKKNKYKIYISALTQLNVDEHNRIPTTDGRLIRRMVRDARTRGTNAKGTIAMWESVRKGE